MNSLVICVIFAVATVSAFPTQSATSVVANTTSIDPLVKAVFDKLTEVVPKDKIEKVVDFTGKAYRASKNLDLNPIVSKLGIRLPILPFSTLGTLATVTAYVVVFIVTFSIGLGMLPGGFVADKWNKWISKTDNYVDDNEVYTNYQPVNQQYPVRYSRALNGLFDVASNVYAAWEKYETLNNAKPEKSE